MTLEIAGTTQRPVKLPGKQSRRYEVLEQVAKHGPEGTWEVVRAFSGQWKVVNLPTVLGVLIALEKEGLVNRQMGWTDNDGAGEWHEGWGPGSFESRWSVTEAAEKAMRG